MIRPFLHIMSSAITNVFHCSSSTDKSSQSSQTSPTLSKLTNSRAGMIKLSRGKYPRSAIVKVGQRYLGIRELASSSLNTSSTQTEDSVASGIKTGTESSEKTVMIVVPETVVNSNKERRREQWRISKRRSRGWYNYKSNMADEQQRKKDEARLYAVRLRQGLTEEEKMKKRSKHQQYKKERVKNENNNQRFWRLVKDRQYRHKGYHNTAIIDQYHSSLGKYGFEKPKFPLTCTTDKHVVSQFIKLFYTMLEKAQDGIIIWENRDTFPYAGISLPKKIFQDFLNDQAFIESDNVNEE